jgi:hypothetical protein
LIVDGAFAIGDVGFGCDGARVPGRNAGRLAKDLSVLGFNPLLGCGCVPVMPVRDDVSLFIG